MPKSSSNVVPMKKKSWRQRLFKRHPKTKKEKLHDALILFIMGTLFLYGAFALIKSVQINQEQKRLAEQVEVKKDVVAGEEKAIANLENQVSLLKDDDYIAKLARSRYYLSKDGEMIFSLPEDNDSKQAKQLNKTLQEKEPSNQAEQGG